jgi:titin
LRCGKKVWNLQKHSLWCICAFVRWIRCYVLFLKFLGRKTMKCFLSVPACAILALIVLATCTNVPDPSAIGQEIAPTVTVPEAPTHLAAVTRSSSKIALLWDSCFGADFYKVFRSTSPDSAFALVAAPEFDSLVDSGLASGTRYYYKVAAVNSKGASDSSSMATAATFAVPPSVPTTVTANAQSSTSIVIKWQPSAGATLYNVYRSTTSGGTFSEVGATATDSFTNNNLTAATAYYYKVTAVDSAGESGFSTAATATTFQPPAQPPSAPTGLSASAQSTTSILVTWKAAVNATQYIVYRSATSAGTYLEVGTTLSDSFTNNGLTAGAAYYYEVTATDSAGESGFSTSATATTPTPGSQLPSAPTGIGAVAQSSASILVTWTAVTGATLYKVYRSGAAGDTFLQVGTTAVDSFTNYGLTASTPYYYKVKAADSAGESIFSNAATTTTLAPALVVPGVPTGVAATAQSSSSITVNWNAVSGATLYKVYRSPAPDSAYVQVAAQASNSFQDNGLLASTPYYYKITAADAAGESGYSSAATATTSAPAVVAPGIPTGVGATAQSSTSIVVSWTAVAGATSYMVFRSATSGGTYVQMGAPALSPFTDDSLSPSTAYYYEVKAVNIKGSSGFSAVATSSTSAPPLQKPVAPTGVGAIAQSSTSIAVSWTAVTDATSYVVFRSTTVGGTYTQVGTPSISPFTDDSLTPSTAYYYEVTAVNSVGASPYSSAATATTQAPPVKAPSAPATVTTIAGDGKVTITWNAVSGAATYNLYYASGTTVTTSGTKVTGVTSPYVQTSLTNGQQYAFAITAVNTAGESGLSTVQTATPQPPAPAIPAISAATAGNTSVTVTWAAVTGAQSYNLYYQAGTSVAAGSATRIPNATSGQAIPGLTNGTTYAFAISAVNGGGESGLSIAQTAVPVPPVPDVPVISGATAGTGSVTVTWNTTAGLSYNLYYQQGSAVVKSSATKNANATSGQAVTGLSSGVQYAFAVSAVNLGGESNLSAVQTGTPLPPVPAAPTISSATGGNAGVTVSWGAVSGATSYNLYYQSGSTVTVGTAQSISGASSGLTVPSLTNGTQYAFAVTAVNAGGESGLSSVQTATPQPSVPGVPSISSATAGNTNVTVSWGVVSGANSYNLYYQAGSTVSIGTATKISGAASGVTVPSLTNGTQYAFAVTAVNGGGESGLSAVQTATPQPPVPAAPTISSATAGNASVTVSWGVVSGATSYNLYYQSGTAVTIGTATKISGAASGVTVPSLTNGTQYAFAVTAVNGGGESGLSAVKTATPQAPLSGVTWMRSSSGGDQCKDSALTFDASGTAEPVTITVDPSTTYQTMQGFGGSFTDAGAYALNTLSAADRATVIKAYFGPTGANYQICRSQMGASDCSQALYSYDDVANDYSLTNFNLSRDSTYILPWIKDALAQNQNLKIIGSPWSAPAWMKSNNNMDNGGTLKTDTSTQNAWAFYFVKYVQAYAAAGVPIWGITIQNEPAATQSWPSMIFSAATERDFLKNYLGPTLAANNLGPNKLNVMFLDHNRDMMVSWASTIYGDATASAMVWGEAIHWYDYQSLFSAVAQVHSTYPAKHILATDACITGYNQISPPSWSNSAELYANDIFGDVLNGSEGWVDLSMILNTQGGPNLANNWCEAGIMINTTTKTYQFTPVYWYMCQFSKYVHTGAVRIGCTASGTNAPQVMAFKNTDGTIAVIAHNASVSGYTGRVVYGPNQIEYTSTSQSIDDFVWSN